MAVLGQLAEKDDALAAYSSGDTRGRLFLEGVSGWVHTRLGSGAARGRCDPLRSSRWRDEQQAAEQQAADRDDRRDENRRDA
jgi:hypothetical protein